MDNNVKLIDIKVTSEGRIETTTSDHDVYIDGLRRSIPEDILKAKEYLSNPKSAIYATRIVPKSVLNLAIDAIEWCIKVTPNKLEDLNSLYNLGRIDEQRYNKMLKIYSAFSTDGYYKSRIRSILMKVVATISILQKHVGTFNYRRFVELADTVDVNKYKYEDITFLPSEELKSICGEHTATDYLTIKYVLEEYDIIKELSNRWSYKSESVDMFGRAIMVGEAIAKPIWINPKYSSVLTDGQTDPVAVPSCGIYSTTAENIELMPETYFASILGILKLSVSNELLQSAFIRSKMHVKRLVREGFEEVDDSDVRKYEYHNALPVDLFDKDGNKLEQVLMTSQASNTIIALGTFDLFKLLRYTIDDYSGRLHTVISRFNSAFRNHLKYNNGEELAEVDIRACQPMIFCSVLAQYGYPHLADKVGDKDFYRCLASIVEDVAYDEVDFTDEKRATYKLTFMQSDYSTGTPFKKFVKKLGKMVEDVSGYFACTRFTKLMYELADGESEINKRDGYTVKPKQSISSDGRYRRNYLPSALPKRMQSIEVDVMFGDDGVIERLIKAGISTLTTIHDAVLVKASDLELARKIMKTTFNEKLNHGCDLLRIEAKAEIIKTSDVFSWNLIHDN